MKTAEGCGHHFGMSSKKRSHIRRAAVETKPANEYVRTTSENLKEVSRSVSALSFSFQNLFLFVQITWSTQLSYSLSPNDDFKSVVANKILCSWTKTEFCVFVTFSHGEVTTGSDYHFRHCDPRINPFATWWYKRPSGTITVHQSESERNCSIRDRTCFCSRNPVFKP